jgi:hypothetical protein
MQQSTSFNLDSRGNETMGGGGNVAINRVEGRHGREEDTTIISNHKRARAIRSRRQRSSGK